jgi:hypothetical protein
MDCVIKFVVMLSSGGNIVGMESLKLKFGAGKCARVLKTRRASCSAPAALSFSKP